MGEHTVRKLLVLALLATMAIRAAAQSPMAKAPEPAVDTQAMTETFKKLLLANLPTPLVESKTGWDIQREVTIGIEWEKVGKIRFRPKEMKAVRNDGHWEKVSVTAVDPEKSLALKLGNVRTGKDGQTLFDADLGLDVRVVYEQQMWAFGKRLYAGETHAKCHTDVKMVVELSNSVETQPGSYLPTLMFRARVKEADLTYRDLVCEHTLGLNGEAAKKLGKIVYDIVKKLKPDLEKDLLSKANAGIVQAADTKELKVEFDKLLAGKPPVVTKGK